MMAKWMGVVGGVAWAVLLLFSPEARAQKVQFCASWIIYSQNAPVVSGIDKGIFKSEGLDVTFVRGYGSGDTVKRMGTGECDFGNPDTGATALGRARGIKAKFFAMIGAKFQQSFFYFAESGIKRPKDLEGRKISGGPKASADIMMWPVYAKANEINTRKVQIVYMGPGALPASLGAGRIDVVISYHNNLPRYRKLAAQSGKKLVFLLWSDTGLDLYANGLGTSDENLVKNKDVTRRFLRGFFKSQRWAFQNREASVNIFLKKYPEQDKATAFQVLDIFFFHMFDKNTDKNGYGHVSREKMERTIRATLEASGVKAKIDPSDLYTNELVEGLPEDLRFFFKR